MLQEPTQAELQEISLDTELDEANETEVDDYADDDLIDLDVLLTESVAAHEKRKAANRRTGSYAGDLPPLDIPSGPCWKTQSSHAVFARNDCACGKSALLFSHFVELQSYTAPAEGKPQRWMRVEERPKVLSASYFIEHQVPFCLHCLPFDLAPTIMLHRVSPKKDIKPIQLNLSFEVSSNAAPEEHH
jgi:hypothetical protein